MSDERFPDPAGRFKQDEPIAIAIVPKTQTVDWSSDERMPSSTLWIPETLFEAAQKIARRRSLRVLASVDIYMQQRFDMPKVKKLAKEINKACKILDDPDVLLCLSLIRKKIEELIPLGSDYELLIEGP